MSREDPDIVRTGGPKLFCDLTQSWSDVGGGVRTYLLHKRRHILESTPHRHLMIVPGARDEVIGDGRAITVTIASPHVPGSRHYRLMLRNRAVREALQRFRPDLIELRAVIFKQEAGKRAHAPERRAQIMGQAIRELLQIRHRFSQFGRPLLHRRLEDQVGAEETPVGLLPQEGDIDTGGVDVDAETLHKLLNVDLDEWAQQVPQMREHYARFGQQLPAGLRAQFDALADALGC